MANSLGCDIAVIESPYHDHLQINTLEKAINPLIPLAMIAQLAGAVEYTDCFSAEG